MLNKRKGITLIALIVTIIVLLILVGITMVVILGPEGILKKAHDSRIASRVVTIKDRITVWQAENKTKRQIGEPPITLEQFLGKLIDEGLMTDVEVSSMVNDTLQIGDEVIYFYNPILSEINIGDTIIYNPTIGAQVSQLTYTSRVGSAEAGKNVSGNGHSVQTFTATSSDDQWIVLGKENGRLKLMSTEPKSKTTGTGLTLSWGQGWLYAEEELHKICSIYGHGKGTDKNQITTYQIGNYEIDGEVKTKTLKGSGARCITLDDLQEITTINLKGDNNTNNPPEATKVYMPSLNGVNPEGKCIDESKKSKIPYTTKWVARNDFNIKEKYQELTKEMIFKDDPYYWVLYRSVSTATDHADFRVCYINSNQVDASDPCSGTAIQFYKYTFSRGIRPIVYLEPEAELNNTGLNTWTVVQE